MRGERGGRDYTRPIPIALVERRRCSSTAGSPILHPAQGCKVYDARTLGGEGTITYQWRRYEAHTRRLVRAGTLFTQAMPAQAIDPITVTSSAFVNNFRQDLTFALQAESSAGKIDHVAIFIQINGLDAVSRQIPAFSPGRKCRQRTNGV